MSDSLLPRRLPRRGRADPERPCARDRRGRLRARARRRAAAAPRPRARRPRPRDRARRGSARSAPPTPRALLDALLAARRRTSPPSRSTRATATSSTPASGCWSSGSAPRRAGCAPAGRAARPAGSRCDRAARPAAGPRRRGAAVRHGAVAFAERERATLMPDYTYLRSPSRRPPVTGCCRVACPTLRDPSGCAPIWRSSTPAPPEPAASTGRGCQLDRARLSTLLGFAGQIATPVTRCGRPTGSPI